MEAGIEAGTRGFWTEMFLGTWAWSIVALPSRQTNNGISSLYMREKSKNFNNGWWMYF
jgi:hypothetical protein